MLYLLLIIYLFFVNTPLIFQSSLFNFNRQPIFSLWQLQRQLPSGGLYIHSHYIRPFIIYHGDRFPLNEPGYDENLLIRKIEQTLQNKRPVFIDSSAIFDPYLYYVGPTLNIFSLSSFGSSTASRIFSRYHADLVIVTNADNRIYAYQLFTSKRQKKQDQINFINTEVISGQILPGKSILIYSTKSFDRILKQRQDYYDPLTWLWFFASKKRELITWVYADRNGKSSLAIAEDLADSYTLRREKVRQPL